MLMMMPGKAPDSGEDPREQGPSAGANDPLARMESGPERGENPGEQGGTVEKEEAPLGMGPSNRPEHLKNPGEQGAGGDTGDPAFRTDLSPAGRNGLMARDYERFSGPAQWKASGERVRGAEKGDPMPWLEPDPARRKNAAKQEAGAEGEDLLSWTSHGPAQGENLAKQGRDIENINPLKQREPVPEHPRERSGQRRPRSQARRQIMTQAGAYFPQEDFPRTAPPSPSPKTRLALTLGLIALVIALVTWGGIWLSGYIQEQNLLRAERLRLEELAREKARHPYPAEYRGLIEDYAREQGVDPALVAAMVLNESSFKPEAESRLGARGLMQLMYDTCDWVAGKLNEPFDFDRMYDPETNIRFGCWFLGYLSRKFDGDPVKMVAGYHAGGGAVDAWESNPAYVQNGQLVAFPESYESTERYVKKVMTAYEMYIKHYYTVEEEPQPQD